MSYLGASGLALPRAFAISGRATPGPLSSGADTQSVNDDLVPNLERPGDTPSSRGHKKRRLPGVVCTSGDPVQDAQDRLNRRQIPALFFTAVALVFGAIAKMSTATAKANLAVDTYCGVGNPSRAQSAKCNAATLASYHSTTWPWLIAIPALVLGVAFGIGTRSLWVDVQVARRTTPVVPDPDNE